jgi:hypothetical protein
MASDVESMMKPSFGLRFVHAHMVCEDALAAGETKRALCEIIRVADDIVWYAVLGRDGGTVSREWVEAARFPEICGQAA